MSRNYNDYGYEYENKSTSLSRKILIIVFILIAIFLILFLMRSCNGGVSKKPSARQEPTFNYENALLEAGKSYYVSNNEEMPTDPGECSIVDLQTLLTNKLIDENDFSKCNASTTFLKVCMLEDKKIHYTPWISCTDNFSNSKYDDLKEGTLNDIVVNKTYTEFKFLPQVINNTKDTLGKVEEIWKNDIKYESYKTLATTTYYRYRDKLFKWNLSTRHYYTSTGDKTKASDVKEYYPLSPKVGYTGYSDRTSEAYKWYTTTGTKVYYPTNGGYSEKAVGDYIYHDDEAYQVIGYSSRSQTGTYDATYYYACATSAKGTKIIYQKVKCGKGSNPSYNYTVDEFYSCALNGESIPANRTNNIKCPKYSEWSAYQTKIKCNIYDTEVCRYKVAYLYKWYKLTNEVRSYYPSKSTTASKEKVYYTSAPIKGAVKDTSTKTNAYKWYSEAKTVSSTFTAIPPSGYSSATKTSDYKWSDWSSWSSKNPKVSDGRTRTIETKTKIKLQQIIPGESAGWTNLTNEYVSEEEMINLFKTRNYNVKTLGDINNNGEIRYQIKMYIRNKKEIE